MDEYHGTWTPSVYPLQESLKTEYVYKNENEGLPKPGSVLGNHVHINPHFNEKKTVFLNPKFHHPNNNLTTRPKIHVNPNMLKSFGSVTTSKVAVNPRMLANAETRLALGKTFEKSYNELHHNSDQTAALVNSQGFDNQYLNSHCKINMTKTTSKATFSKTNSENVLANMKPIPSAQVPKVDKVKLNESGQVHWDSNKQVHTRLKIVNESINKTEVNPILKRKQYFQVRDKMVSTKYKFVRKSLAFPKKTEGFGPLKIDGVTRFKLTKTNLVAPKGEMPRPFKTDVRTSFKFVCKELEPSRNEKFKTCKTNVDTRFKLTKADLQPASRENSEPIKTEVIKKLELVRKVLVPNTRGERSEISKTNESEKKVIENLQSKTSLDEKNAVFTQYKYRRNGGNLKKINTTPMKSTNKVLNRYKYVRDGTKLIKINTTPMKYKDKNAVLTRYKYIKNVANLTKINTTPIKDRNAVLTRYKYRKNGTKLLKINTTPMKSNNKNSISTKYKFIRNTASSTKIDKTPVQDKNIASTRYKHINNRAKLMKINKTVMKSKYRIVNDASGGMQGKKSIPTHNSSVYKKRYVFVNKYNSSSFVANNVIFKNTKQHDLMKINGILYQNPPCLLKNRSNGKASTTSAVQSKGKYQIVRSTIASAGKLKKSNMVCPIYKRTGKCKGQKNGSCIKVHNPNLIILCKSFLRGECHNDECLLSHKVSSEKMPTCKYFLEGACNKVGCQYLHVKISPTAEICKEFLEGFCKEGMKCDKRHQFLCPEYEKTQKCTRPKCTYPHGTSTVVNRARLVKKNAIKITPKILNKLCLQNVEDNCQIRYYDDETSSVKQSKDADLKTFNEEGSIPRRKKLGLLPSFIPIS